jgi:hypothetical protein
VVSAHCRDWWRARKAKEGGAGEPLLGDNGEVGKGLTINETKEEKHDFERAKVIEEVDQDAPF